MKERDMSAKSFAIRKHRKATCPLCGLVKSRNYLADHSKRVHTKLSKDAISKILESLKLERESEIRF